MSRVFADERDIMLQQTKKAWEEEINDALTGEIAGDVNQALMELGATVCVPNGDLSVKTVHFVHCVWHIKKEIPCSIP